MRNAFHRLRRAHGIALFFIHRRSQSRSTSAYLAHVAAGKIEIRQLTPDRRFTGAGPETDGPRAKARGNCRRDGRVRGSLYYRTGCSGNKRAQVTARRERSHVPGICEWSVALAASYLNKALCRVEPITEVPL